MPVNMDRLREEREKRRQGGADFWKIPEGETLLYIGYPLPNDDIPFVESVNHYDVGPTGKGIATCLDLERNPVLKDPRVKKILVEQRKDITGGCPCCRGIDEENKQAGRNGQSRYYFNVIPLKYRRNSSKKWREADDADELKVLECGFTIWSGIVDVFINNGDISNPTSAILIRLVREGTDRKTRYTVSADTDSVRDGGVELRKGLRGLLKKQITEGEAGNLYRVVANKTKGSAEIEALVEGIELEEPEEEGDEPSKTDDKENCYGIDYDPKDSECKKCPDVKACQAECEPPGKGKSSTSDEAVSDEELEEEGDEETATGEYREVNVKDCVIGLNYTEDADVPAPMRFTGTTRKGRGVIGIFEDEDGDKIRMRGKDTVYLIPGQEAPLGLDDDEDDDDLDDDIKALDKAIANRKKRKARQ